MDQPRNLKIEDVTFNYARLVTAVETPFKTFQYEMQMTTTDVAKAESWKQNHLKVKVKDGVYSVSLSRKAHKSDGSDNGAPRVLNGDLSQMSEQDIRELGNGSVGSVVIWQYPFDQMGNKGIGNSLTAVHITEYKRYVAGGSVDSMFTAVPNSTPVAPAADTPESGASLF